MRYAYGYIQTTPRYADRMRSMFPFRCLDIQPHTTITTILKPAPILLPHL